MLGAALALSAFPATASAAAGLKIVGESGSRSVPVTHEGNLEAGSLRLLVQNETSRTAHPHVRVIPDSESPPPELDYSAPQIASGRLGVIVVTLKAPQGTSLSGTLALKADGGPEVAVPFSAAGTPPPQDAVEPEQITVHQTRYCPFGHFICGDAAAPTVAIDSATLGAAPNGSLKRLASSSTGGTLTVELKRTRKQASGVYLPPGMSDATVSVSGATTHGAYSTTFTLLPEAKSGGALTVNVEVQDWWLYPFAVLFVGAVAGFFVRWLMGGYRDKLVLRAQLLEQRNIYGSRLAGHAKGIYPLESWFGPFGVELPSLPGKRDCGSDTLTGFGDAYCEVLLARSPEEIESAKTTVERLSSDVETWRQVNKTLKELDRVFQAAEPDKAVRDDDTIAAYVDTRMLVEEQVIDCPQDAAAGAALIALIRGQGVVVSLFAHAHRLWRSLSEAERRRHEALDPFKIYEDAGGVLSRDAPHTEALKAALAKATTGLEAVIPGGQAPPAMTVAVVAALDSTLAQNLTATIPGPMSEVIGLEPPPVSDAGEVEAAQPSASQTPNDPLWIRGMVQRMDVLVFFATLLASSAAYFLTLYVGKNFGGTSQYVEAFAVGFVGQAIVGVATIPLARSVLSVSKQASS